VYVLVPSSWDVARFSGWIWRRRGWDGSGREGRPLGETALPLAFTVVGERGVASRDARGAPKNATEHHGHQQNKHQALTLFSLPSGKRRYNIKLWKTFTDCFNCLPIAAIIDEKIFTMHGGLSPDLQSMEQIRRVMRPTDVPDTG
jgi:hypothetical protein